MNPATRIKKYVKRKAQRRLPRNFLFKCVTAVVILGAVNGFMLLMPAVVLNAFGLQRPMLPVASNGLRVYDRYDKLVCTIYGERDQHPVKLNQVSQYVPKAFMAAEDHDFYRHHGIDLSAVARAIFVNISNGQALQGGSTISQQLIKNLYYEGKQRGAAEKLAEAFMTLDIENRYSKDQILEAYINNIYFGRGAYGIESASRTYFAKAANKLTPAEAAFLAGLVNRPSDLSRPQNRQEAIRRQQMILNSMAKLKYASAAQISAAKKEKLNFKSDTIPSRRYRAYLDQVLLLTRENLPGEDIFENGYEVHTNLDVSAQTLAENMVKRGIKSAPAGINEGALVSISVKDGAIVALVGGVESSAQWNRALNPHTAGSAFKPFVYLAALAEGTLHPDDLIRDEPLTIQQAGAPAYNPQNFDGSYMGDLTIRKAIALSRNTCAVRVARDVGTATVIDYARKAGITSKLDNNLSLALGSSAVSPLEMANAYATLARGGEFIEPHLLRFIADKKGKPIKEFTAQRSVVFEREPVAQVVDALEDVVEKGTGTRARLFDRPVAGKTGTSDQGKDIWFVGFTPDLVTAVWGGNDANKPVRGQVTGGAIMAKIWHNYMKGYYQAHTIPAGKFIQPEHPLMEEPEPIHIWPFPSPVLQVFDGWVSPGAAGGSGVREYNWREEDGDSSEKKPRKRRGLLKKIKDWFDF